jgi:MFS transporter, DHA1 family, tetracycline resistance protein
MTDAPLNGAPRVRRAALVFIFITVMLDMMALGMVIPVLPKLVETFVDGDTVTAAWLFGLFGAVWAFMQFVFSPVLGALSDRYGRRPVILLSNFGMGLDYILMALAPTVLILFVGRVISGITASSISAAYAYIADVTAPEKRARAFGLLGAAFGAGFVLGPAIGGLLASHDPRTPFWVAAAFSLANAAYGAFILPESLKREHRARFDWRKANPFGSMQLLRSHPELTGLAAANFLAFVAHNVLQSIFVLYAGYRYGWDAMTVGLTLGAVGICFAFVQAGLTGHVVVMFGERRALFAGLFFGAVGFAIFGFAPNQYWFWAGIPVTSLWGLAGPAILGMMTRRVTVSEQGRLQGAITSLTGIANMIGPLIFSAVFAWSIGGGRDVLPTGSAFFVGALMLLAGALVSWRATRPRT